MDHILEQEQWIDAPLGEVFPFFADAHNLEHITPGFLRFSVLTPAPIPMRVGQRIDYRLRLRGLPLRWRSEISAWDPPYRFVDRQLRGPYSLWEHEHLFEDHGQRTRVIDRVRYRVLGPKLIHDLFVRPDLERIFAHRRQALEERFARRAAA